MVKKKITKKSNKNVMKKLVEVANHLNTKDDIPLKDKYSYAILKEEIDTHGQEFVEKTKKAHNKIIAKSALRNGMKLVTNNPEDVVSIKAEQPLIPVIVPSVEQKAIDELAEKLLSTENIPNKITDFINHKINPQNLQPVVLPGMKSPAKEKSVDPKDIEELRFYNEKIKRLDAECVTSDLEVVIINLKKEIETLKYTISQKDADVRCNESKSLAETKTKEKKDIEKLYQDKIDKLKDSLNFHKDDYKFNLDKGCFEPEKIKSVTHD